MEGALSHVAGEFRDVFGGVVGDGDVEVGGGLLGEGAEGAEAGAGADDAGEDGAEAAFGVPFGAVFADGLRDLDGGVEGYLGEDVPEEGDDEVADDLDGDVSAEGL
ncbi:hypothetical protein V6U90_21160 [Micromonospora sp. CPCC 206060]|uniref:hypothetical protein n=1 Tax=Micromonospora sp. CPCC 206060 TaxID=3122406 RepID=UPI002FF2DD3A